MTQIIKDIKPNEKGTAVVTLTFTDEDGVSVTPSSLEWQLMRGDGTIINNRSFANGSFSGDTIVLSGDDLAVFGNRDNGSRVLSIQGEYDSSAGNGLQLKDECQFNIQRLLGQTDES